MWMIYVVVSADEKTSEEWYFTGRIEKGLPVWSGNLIDAWQTDDKDLARQIALRPVNGLVMDITPPYTETELELAAKMPVNEGARLLKGTHDALLLEELKESLTRKTDEREAMKIYPMNLPKGAKQWTDTACGGTSVGAAMNTQEFGQLVKDKQQEMADATIKAAHDAMNGKVVVEFNTENQPEVSVHQIQSEWWVVKATYKADLEQVRYWRTGKKLTSDRDKATPINERATAEHIARDCARRDDRLIWSIEWCVTARKLGQPPTEPQLEEIVVLPEEKELLALQQTAESAYSEMRKLPFEPRKPDESIHEFGARALEYSQNEIHRQIGEDYNAMAEESKERWDKAFAKPQLVADEHASQQVDAASILAHEQKWGPAWRGQEPRLKTHQEALDTIVELDRKLRRQERVIELLLKRLIAPVLPPVIETRDEDILMKVIRNCFDACI